LTRRSVPPSQRLDALAQSLDLDVDSSGVCLACLSFVSFPLGDGKETLARREARRMAGDVWDDGLDVPLLAALTRARDDGVPDAEAALDDVQARGPRSAVVRAVVLRLAAELAERARVEASVLPKARPPSSPGLPELN
jgi:hypothetical protein